jgi:signal transduction histidine kinase
MSRPEETQPAHDPLIDAVGRMAVVPRILQAVVRRTGMRFAAVARVTDTRWTACAVQDDLGFGLGPGQDLTLETTICNDIRDHHQPVVFGHASAHPVYSQHHTPRFYRLESYASVPIFTLDGEFFGTLCAIDSRPVPEINEALVAAEMMLYGELIASHMALEDRLDSTERALDDEVSAGVLREQFLAVVGHDLRSPVQAVRMAAETLDTLELPPRARRLSQIIADSSRRMTGLIDDVMDFARARLAAGIPMAKRDDEDLNEVVSQVVAEVAAGHPEVVFVVTLKLPTSLRFDPVRMQQLMANLLNNAIAHGDTRKPIVVRGYEERGTGYLSVTNAGPAIDAATQAMMFHPFQRPDSSTPRPGLGLGLYIASEIAKGHGATLSVHSDETTGTCFTLAIPL